MRNLKSSPQFQKILKRFLGKHKELENQFKSLLEGLQKNVFNPKYKTHKLSGKLGSLYGAHINYQYRIVFYFDEKFIYLVNIGDHDDVY